MHVTLDTGTPLGVLETQRTVMIDDPVFDILASQYLSACDGGNVKWAAQVRDKLLSRRLMRKLKPGQAVRIDLPNSVNAAVPKGFSASMKWYAEGTCLRAVVNVIDPDYPEDTTAGGFLLGGLVKVTVSPCGPDVEDAVNRFDVTPLGGGSARIYSYETREYLESEATWEKTPVGYRVGVQIPYSELMGCEEGFRGWEMMPVDAVIERRTLTGGLSFGMDKSTKQGTAVCCALVRDQ